MNEGAGLRPGAEEQRHLSAQSKERGDIQRVVSSLTNCRPQVNDRLLVPLVARDARPVDKSMLTTSGIRGKARAERQAHRRAEASEP